MKSEDEGNLLDYSLSPDKKFPGYGAFSSPDSQSQAPCNIYPNIQEEPQMGLVHFTNHGSRILSQTSSIGSFVSPSDEVFLRAAVLIEDAMRYRPTYHRLSYTALKLYKFYHSRLVQFTLGLCIAVNLALAFFEKPSSISETSDYRYKQTKNSSRSIEPPCGLTEAIELVTLLVFLVDYIVVFYQVGWRAALTKIWLHLYVWSILISIVDLTVSLGLVCGSYIGVRKLLRPIFLFQHSSYMKKSLKAIRLTVPQMFAVFFMLCLHIFVFAILGMLLFPKSSSYNGTNLNCSRSFQRGVNETHCTEGDLYFSGLVDSIRNLIFLLSTANNPNFMIPAYQENRLYALYFITFFTIGSYVLLNIFTAVVYNQFRRYLQTSMEQSSFMRRVGMRAAFLVLERMERDEELGIVDKVSLDTLTKLVSHLGFVRKQSLEVYKEEISLWRSQEVFYLKWGDFQGLINKLFQLPQSYHRKRGIIYHNNHLIRMIQWAILSPIGLIFQNLISLLNTVIICVELELYDADYPQIFSLINFIFVCYYIMELFAKFIFLRAQFFKRKNNIYDLIVTSAIAIIQFVIICYVGVPFKNPPPAALQTTRILIKVLCMLIVLRLLRLLTVLKTFSFIIEIIFTIMKKFKSFAGLMLSLYYFFAFLGMMLFSDVDKKVVDGKRQKECGTFEELEFFANNFKDFYAAIILLWDLMIVNDWNVFVEAYRKAYTEWVVIYFFAWYILSVIIGVNLLIAIILEAFITCWDERNNKNEPTLEQVEPLRDNVEHDPEMHQNISVRGFFRSRAEPDSNLLGRAIEKHPFL